LGGDTVRYLTNLAKYTFEVFDYVDAEILTNKKQNANLFSNASLATIAKTQIEMQVTIY
jgi:hypothetical protein